MKVIDEEPGVVADRINFLLRDALESPEPRLFINSDGLVLEYNIKVPSGRQAKFMEKVAKFARRK